MANFTFIEHLGNVDIKIFCVSIQRRWTHYHSDIEIFTPIEGSVVIDLGVQRTTVEAGDFFVINRNEVHSLSYINGSNMLLVLQFNPGFCKSYYPMLSRMKISNHHIRSQTMPMLQGSMRRCFLEILRTVGKKNDGYQLKLLGALNRLAYAIVSCGEIEDTASKTAAGEDRQRQRLANILDYVQKNYTSNLSLAELSRREGLDMAYLSHYIKKNLGISFREYVNHLRFEHAIDLVVNTDMRFIDICIECGYSDYRYLNKAFRQKFDMTPAQLRQQGISDPPSSAYGYSDSENQQSYINIASSYESICRKLERENEVYC